MIAGVALDHRSDGWLDAVASHAADAGDDVRAGLDLAIRLGPDVPLPADRRTATRWNVLASAAAGDVTAARVVEPHLDALAILGEADTDGHRPDLPSLGVDASSCWGVFAAEGPGTRLTATQDADGWRLDGVKPWCSLAGMLSHGLITAHTDAGRRLFAVGLRAPGVRVQDGGWHAKGLSTVVSGPVEFAAVRAVPVGPAGWYLARPGFWWGGIGVAAVWWGGAVGVARALHARCHSSPDQPVLVLHLGAVDAALHASGAVLAAAAADIDEHTGVDGRLLAARVRGTVHDSAEFTLLRTGHALGPAPLALDAAHARRVADLTLYLRQHHAERDQADTGRYLAEAESPPW